MSLNIDAALCSELKSLIERILKLTDEYKYIEAKLLYNRLLSKLCWNSEKEEGNAAKAEVVNIYSKTLTDLLEDHKSTFEMMLCRVDEVEYALANISLDQSLAATKSDACASSTGPGSSDSGASAEQMKWVFGSRYLGVTTHYVVRPDGLLTLHVDGVVDNLPFFEQLCVINEIDLFKEWVPFCYSSEMLHRVGHAELLAHFHVSLGLFSRDCAVRCYGADCLAQHDCVIIMGSSVPTPHHGETADFPAYRLENGDTVEVPWTSSTAAAARTSNTPSMLPSFLSSLGGSFASLGSHSHMELKDIRAVFKILTPDSAKATLIYTVDPRANIPQFVLNFAIKNLAGMLLYLLQTQADKIRTDMECRHAVRMRENSAFYHDWLLPKFRDYCALRQWPQPTIAALKEAGLAPDSWELPPDDPEIEADTALPTVDAPTPAPVPVAVVTGGAVTLVSAIEKLLIDAEEHVHDASPPRARPSDDPNPNPKAVTISGTVESLMDISTPPVQHY